MRIRRLLHFRSAKDGRSVTHVPITPGEEVELPGEIETTHVALTEEEDPGYPVGQVMQAPPEPNPIVPPKASQL